MPVDFALRELIALPRRLPAPARRLLAGRAIALDGQVLDAQAQIVCRLMRVLDKPPAAQPLKLLRARFDWMASRSDAPPRLAHTSDRSAGGIPARVYHPRPGAVLPGVVYLHGGGFVLGGLESHDAICHRLAHGADAVVVAIDYRLAPEHVFPAAVDDAVSAFRWVRANAAALEIDGTRVGVAGDSAGGCLSAVVSQLLRGEVKYQVLIYPVTEARGKTRSRELFARGFVLEGTTLDWFMDQYVPRGLERDPRASPLLAGDLSGVAPACVLTAGFDPLRDEGDAYAVKLSRAGVPVEHVCERSLIHGFVSLGMVDAGIRALERAALSLGTGLRA
jgi:acetyl esterase